MDTTTSTVQSLAAEAYGYFESAERSTPQGTEVYIRTKDNRPEWVQELCFEAHGDMFPDDWKYECIMSALEHISDSDDPEDGAGEFADGYVDVYNAARFAWLASNLTRAGYVDEARDEGLIGPDTDTVDQIGIGQYMEASEVYGLVLRFLENRVDELESEES